MGADNNLYQPFVKGKIIVLTFNFSSQSDNRYVRTYRSFNRIWKERHHAELALYYAAERYLKNLKSGGKPLTPKKWQADISILTARKDLGYKDIRAMWEQLKVVETLKKTAIQNFFHAAACAFHFPNKSLCVPVRANVSINKSSSMR